MPSPEYDATAKEIRTFALVQVALTTGFFVLLFWMLGGVDADFPPIWLAVSLVVLVAIGAVLAERVWLSAAPLPADTPGIRAKAIRIFAAQTVRRMVLCEIPLLIAVFLSFVADHGAWPMVIAGLPGLAVLAWEIWPSLRNTSMTAAMLDSGGAESHLVESFLEL